MTGEIVYPHLVAAERYVDEVLSGKRVAGELERLAAERHRRDLAASEAGGRWVLDPVRATKACRFLERLKHVAGRWGGQYLKLEGWQCFIVVSIFGWVDRATGLRRFRSVFLEIGRKNGKSLLLAGIGLYCLAIDGPNPAGKPEPGAEVYAAAVTRDQALRVFDPARRMAMGCRDLITLGGVKVMVRQISGRDGAVFMPLPSQTKAGDGFNPHCSLIDELHEHPTRAVLDVLASGQGARDQPLQIVITTAGNDLSGPCYEEHADLEKILRGIVEDDSAFGIIFAIDEADEPFDEAVWPKANPNLDISVSWSHLRSEAAKAARVATKAGDFRRKHCCRWSAAGHSAFDLDAWRARRDPDLALEDLRGLRDLTIGLDGSKNNDLSSIVAAGWDGADLVLWDEHFATEAVVNEPGNEHLAAWAEAGWLNVCPGALVDLGALGERVVEIAGEISPGAVAFDPLYLMQTAAEIEAAPGVSCPVIEQKQSTLALDPALRTAQGVIAERRAVNRGNPVLDWMVSNARAKMSHGGGSEFLRLFKMSPRLKIDGVQAMITALARMEAPAADEAHHDVVIPRGYEMSI